MRTFKLILLSLLLVAGICSAAAPWDGTKGDLSIATYEHDGQTFINVICANPTVTAVRVEISFTTPDGEITSTQAKTVDLRPRYEIGSGNFLWSFAAAGFTVPMAQIALGPQITERFDGPVISFR